jgi:hypothetical protein
MGGKTLPLRRQELPPPGRSNGYAPIGETQYFPKAYKIAQVGTRLAMT